MHSDFTAVRDALTSEEVTFATLEVRGDRARVAPTVPLEALFAHLNEHFAEAWNLGWHLDHPNPTIVRCRLEFLGHAREGIASAIDLEHARRAALTDAVRAWGFLPDQYTMEDTWVEYDPEDGANTTELISPAAPARRTATVLPEPPRDPQMERARKHIDDLMDQLREQGRGKQASLVLVKHGGYGETVDESRRVYAELKALLRT